MIGISNEKHPYTLFLSKEEFYAVYIALKDALDEHDREGNLYSSLTANAMRRVFFDVSELLG